MGTVGCKLTPQMLGYRCPQNIEAINHNSANTRAAHSFIATHSKTINNISVVFNTVAGTQANRSIGIEIYSDVNGAPGASLAGPITATNFALGWVTATGMSYALIEGARYWIVTSNSAAAPNVDTFSVQAASLRQTEINSSNSAWGNAWIRSADGGATWVSSAVGSGSWMIEYSDGSFEGFPEYNHTTLTARLYGTLAFGISLVSPEGPSYLIDGITVLVRKVGAPTGNLHCKLLVGGVEHTTLGVGAGNIPGIQWVPLRFASAVIIPPNTEFKLYAVNSAADDVGNAFALTQVSIFDNINAKALLNWSLKSVSTADKTGTPISWTENTTTLYGLIAIFDRPEFSVAASGGGAQLGAFETGAWR